MRGIPENQVVGYQSWFNLILVAKHHKVRGGLTAAPSHHNTGARVSGVIQPLRSVSSHGNKVHLCRHYLQDSVFSFLAGEMAIVTRAEHVPHFLALWPPGLQHPRSASNY